MNRYRIFIWVALPIAIAIGFVLYLWRPGSALSSTWVVDACWTQGVAVVTGLPKGTIKGTGNSFLVAGAAAKRHCELLCEQTPDCNVWSVARGLPQLPGSPAPPLECRLFKVIFDGDQVPEPCEGGCLASGCVRDCRPGSPKGPFKKCS